VLAALDEVATRQLGVFTTAQALAAGHTRDEVRAFLRTKRWIRVRRGVYCSADVWTGRGDRAAHVLDCAAVLLSLGRPAAVSHASAAAVHELLPPSSPLTEVRLTDPDAWRRGRGYVVSRAQLPAGEVVPWGPFAVSSVARSLVDCARECCLADAVAAMDDALHRDLVTPAQLREIVHAQRHWEGIAGAARAVGMADGRAESPLESRGRVQILTSGLPAPELQPELWDGDGYLGRVDAWYDDAAVAIEFDGVVKYRDPWRGRSPADVLWEEKRREDRIRATGVRMLRWAMVDVSSGWAASRDRLRRLLASPHQGRRAFRVVRAVPSSSR
jgi:predicted transcriptional regulator of viral defense system